MQNFRISIIFDKIKALIKEKSLLSKKDKDICVDYTKDRQYVGNIIISVMTEQISVKQGLLLFPKSCEDESVHAAWHALCHYEADEDIKKKNIDYNNQQVELLELIAFAFKDGNPLPQNIIDAYKPYYKDDPMLYEKGVKGLIKSMLRFLNS